MSSGSTWSDLTPRVLSAVIMVVIGGIDIYIGGWPFSVAVWGVCGLMTWELARMQGASSPLMLGLLAAVALALVEIVPPLVGSKLPIVPLIAAAVFVGMGQVVRDRHIYVIYATWIMVGCLAMLMLRQVAGLGWISWLIAVVVVSDIAGYFAGRMLGGPKFWPKVSPKKTWSGTIAGWIGAGGVGVGFAGFLGAGLMLVPISMVTSLAGQMGDIAESAIKRRAGVKDSSSLIPGHGGVLDRFDAMLGAALFILMLWTFGWMPGLS